MLLLIFIILFFAVREDAKIFRRHNEELYLRIFRFTELQWAVFCALFLIGALPVYMLRRQRMLKGLDAAGSPLSRDQRVVSDALWIVFGWILFMALWAVGAEVYDLIFPKAGEEIVGMLVSAALLFTVVLSLIYRTTQSYPEKFLKFVAWHRNEKPLWQVIVVPVVLGLVFAYLSTEIISSRAVQPITPLSKVIEETTSSFWMFVFLMMAVVVAPAVEEIIFRGYFYRVLALAKGRIPAIIAVAAVFAFLHVGQYWGDWAAIAMVSVLGLALTVVRVWTGSTIASAVMHYIYNAALTILPVIILVLANPVYSEYQMRYAELSFSEKESLLQKSIEEYPDFDAAYNDLAWIYAQENRDLDHALKLAEQAVAKSPGNPAYRDTQAEVLYRLGRTEEAAAIAEELLQKDPSSEYFRSQLERFSGGGVSD